MLLEGTVLLEGGGDVWQADPNARNQRGMTTLHTDKALNSPDVMKELLKRGGNPNAKCLEDGKTPLHLASADVIEVLLEGGADAYGVRDGDGTAGCKTAYDVQTKAIRDAIDAYKLFCGRFEISSVTPEHVSETSLVLNATDKNSGSVGSRFTGTNTFARARPAPTRTDPPFPFPPHT